MTRVCSHGLRCRGIADENRQPDNGRHDGQIELHPGAVRYYKEIGAL